jgi:ribonuclease VapC
MIAVDTSALIAIALKEPQAEACKEALVEADEVVVSAGTLTELMILAIQQDTVRLAVTNLLENFGLNVVAVTQTSAERIGQVYERWGKGIRPAGLNFGDCFAYDVAKQFASPLLFVGNDFSKTDIESVL